MQLITRAALLSTLCGENHDPEKEFGTEMSAFANAILADSEADFFLHLDYENGDDPVVEWSEGQTDLVKNELIPTVTGQSLNGYFGMDESHTEFNPLVRRYACYLGGSQWQSAAGFVILTLFA